MLGKRITGGRAQCVESCRIEMKYRVRYTRLAGTSKANSVTNCRIMSWMTTAILKKLIAFNQYFNIKHHLKRKKTALLVSIWHVGFPGHANKWAAVCGDPWAGRGEPDHLRSTRANHWKWVSPSLKWPGIRPAAAPDTRLPPTDHPVHEHCFAPPHPKHFNLNHFANQFATHLQSRVTVPTTSIVNFGHYLAEDIIVTDRFISGLSFNVGLMSQQIKEDQRSQTVAAQRYFADKIWISLQEYLVESIQFLCNSWNDRLQKKKKSNY